MNLAAPISIGHTNVRLAPYRNRLYGYALALTRDAEDAAELAQDCVLRVIEARRVPADEAAYRAWLFTILRNLWQDRLRKLMVREERHAGWDAGPDLAQLAQEDITVNAIAVRQAFARLTSEHRDILALVDVAGFGYKEASQILGVPEGTVMSRVSRARAVLCRLLADGTVLQLPASGRKTVR